MLSSAIMFGKRAAAILCAGVVLVLAVACNTPVSAVGNKDNSSTENGTRKHPPIEVSSIAAMKQALDEAVDRGNSADDPIEIGISGYELTPAIYLSILKVCTKFVELDLSGCSGTIMGGVNDGVILQQRSYIVGLTLPESITVLGFSALASTENADQAPPFEGYTNLKTLAALGVKSVAGYALFGAVNLETVIFPSVERIASGAFTSNRKLSTLVFGDIAPALAENIFDLCASERRTIAIVFPEGSEENYGMKIEEVEEEEEEEEEYNAVMQTTQKTEGLSWFSKIGANSSVGYFWDSFEVTRDNLTVTLSATTIEYY